MQQIYKGTPIPKCDWSKNFSQFTESKAFPMLVESAFLQSHIWRFGVDMVGGGSKY